MYDIGNGWTAERTGKDFSHYDRMVIRNGLGATWKTEVHQSMTEEAFLDQARFIAQIWDAGYDRGFRDGETGMWKKIMEAMQNGPRL